mmetsp:Transcript_2095/g.3263  ORF Transcript_2095/g.3263 Transcript_2095/m.3263 type:complete len:393 (+) Transcript_2095:193-1371(+)
MCCFDCCSCLDPPDEWTITDEARKGERGAGWLYKQGKSRGNWSKRYFVLTDYTLKYFSDASRTKLKGEIVLVGASCKSNDTLNKKKQYHFTINHPKCGTRQFYAKTNNRKEQWLNRLTEILAGIERSGSLYGSLHKKGGISKNTWQERWCVLAGTNLDYYENCGDSLPKGTIPVQGSKVREFSSKDKKYCFEIVAQGRKGLKKYSFLCETAGDRKRWVDQLKRVSKAGAMAIHLEGDDDVNNPMREASESGSPGMDDDTASTASGGSMGDMQLSYLRKSSLRNPPNGMEGFLMKKSPALLTGWQKRYFVIQDPGEVNYYLSREDYLNGHLPKGTILIAEVLPDSSGIELANEKEIRIHMGKRTFQLMARDGTEAESWVTCLNEWVNYLSSYD